MWGALVCLWCKWMEFRQKFSQVLHFYVFIKFFGRVNYFLFSYYFMIWLILIGPVLHVSLSSPSLWTSYYFSYVRKNFISPQVLVFKSLSLWEYGQLLSLNQTYQFFYKIAVSLWLWHEFLSPSNIVWEFSCIKWD